MSQVFKTLLNINSAILQLFFAEQGCVILQINQDIYSKKG